MIGSEIYTCYSKLNLLENTEKLQVFFVELGENPISFYEALALYLAGAHSDPSRLNINTFYLSVPAAA